VVIDDEDIWTIIAATKKLVVALRGPPFPCHSKGWQTFVQVCITKKVSLRNFLIDMLVVIILECLMQVFKVSNYVFMLALIESCGLAAPH
jgi:hypothetical protein